MIERTTQLTSNPQLRENVATLEDRVKKLEDEVFALQKLLAPPPDKAAPQIVTWQNKDHKPAPGSWHLVTDSKITAVDRSGFTVMIAKMSAEQIREFTEDNPGESLPTVTDAA